MINRNKFPFSTQSINQSFVITGATHYFIFSSRATISVAFLLPCCPALLSNSLFVTLCSLGE